MNDQYIFKQIINVIHTEIRKINRSGEIVNSYGDLLASHDPFQMDQVFLQEVLGRGVKQLPDIFCEKDHIYYGLIALENREKILIGPVRVIHEGNDLVQFMIHEHQLQETKDYKLPYCDLYIFLNSVILLNHFLTEQEVYLDELCTYNGLTEKEVYAARNEISNVVFYHREVEVPHNPYDHEVRKMDSIKNGNIDSLLQCQREIWIGQLGKVAHHPVRQAKNMAVIVISLAARAAIQGGLSSELSFSMADGFILTIENMSNILQIQATMNQAEVEFALAVIEQNKSKKKHILVEKTKEYIFKHLHQVIRVSEIGEVLSVNTDYLSTVFSKEEGITIQRYILKEKIKQSKELLQYSNYSIYEIANYLSFSSQSHFGLTFKKIEGITPKQYRNHYAKI